MGSLSRLSHGISSSDNHLIYVCFCAKNGSSSISNFIDCYDTSNHSWHRATSIPSIEGEGENQVLKDFCMVSLGDYIYIVGGRLCRMVLKHETDSVQETSGMVLSSVRRYNTRTNSWEICKPMTSPRFNFAGTVCDGKIYAAGGQSTLGQAKGLSSAEIYDPALDEWRFLANMTTMRYKCVGAAWQGTMHVFGGFVERGNGGDSLGPFMVLRSSAEVYDAQNDRWNFKARMWELDIPPCQIVVVNGKLFSSGDCLKPWKGHIETYNERENIWNAVQGSHCDDLSSSSGGRLYLTMAAVGSQLFYLTGYKVAGMESRVRTEVHVFETASSGYGWRRLVPSMEEEGLKELCGHCCVQMRQVHS